MTGGIRKHLQAAWEAYKADRKERGNRRRHADTAFLPPALEILETPPNPLGRIVLWVMIAFLLLAFAWSVIGRVDIVASAPGKVIPEGRVKVIQAAGEGVVREILVRDGQRVKAGAPVDAVVLVETLVFGVTERVLQELRHRV